MSTAHNATIITSTPPIFMFLFSAIFLNERMTWKKGSALIVSTIGVLIVIGTDVSKGESMIGDIVLVFAAVSWALFSVLLKPLSEKYTSTIVTFYCLLFACFFTIPGSIYEFDTHQFTHAPDYLVCFGILYVGIIATAAGFWLWNKGVLLSETNTAGLFLFVQPISGTFLAWFLLGEHLSSTFYYGSLLIIIGIVVSQLNFKRSLLKA
jgi:drug/metabolite transporter (DMT)-like permease